ncbi:hypothetical protein HanIR_Chr11g0547281 [Helianthus annuus]|nr:hypothetical protein HanIR_Chr11g0547281 [Helianthus annuus]
MMVGTWCYSYTNYFFSHSVMVRDGGFRYGMARFCVAIQLEFDFHRAIYNLNTFLVS